MRSIAYQNRISRTCWSRIARVFWTAWIAASAATIPPAGAQPPPATGMATEEKYLPCSSGPPSLRQIDSWEREGRGADIRHEGRLMSGEALAEMLISDCSQQLALMSAAARLDEGSSLKAVVSAWQTNLDFMKWWLQNRRDKTQKKRGPS